MRRATVVVGLTFLMALPSQVKAASAEDGVSIVPVDPTSLTVSPPTANEVGPSEKRSTLLTSLYASYAAMQLIDFHCTNEAIQDGARMVNPLAAPFAGSTGAMLALKAASTVSTIYFVDRMRQKNRVAAIVTMVGINGVTALMLARNARNAQHTTR